MRTVSSSNFIIGIFKRELKNRFLCEVNIDGIDVVCYVPSSCHLSNFVRLEGKEVLLVPTKTPHARTKYALFAVPYKKNFIILNTSMANKVIELNIHKRIFSFLGKRKQVIKEHIIKNYKADLYLPETKTILEIKSVISLEKNALFPTVYSERALNQLKLIQDLLMDEYKVCFCIISLNPYIKQIELNKNSEFYDELNKCLSLGMNLISYSCRLNEGKPEIFRKISILF